MWELADSYLVVLPVQVAEHLRGLGVPPFSQGDVAATMVAEAERGNTTLSLALLDDLTSYATESSHQAYELDQCKKGILSLSWVVPVEVGSILERNS